MLAGGLGHVHSGGDVGQAVAFAARGAALVARSGGARVRTAWGCRSGGDALMCARGRRSGGDALVCTRWRSSGGRCSGATRVLRIW